MWRWVPFVLFLQGILFYIPHIIFKKAEGGKVNFLLSQGWLPLKGVPHEIFRVLLSMYGKKSLVVLHFFFSAIDFIFQFKV
jgi:hypothetical protein